MARGDGVERRGGGAVAGGGGWRGVAGEFREVGSVPGEGVGGRGIGEWGYFEFSGCGTGSRGGGKKGVDGGREKGVGEGEKREMGEDSALLFG